MATTDESDQALTQDEIREQNFEAARQAAVDNAATDLTQVSVGTTDKEELKANGGAPREIPAQPEATEAANPEQVALEDTPEVAETPEVTTETGSKATA